MSQNPQPPTHHQFNGENININYYLNQPHPPAQPPAVQQPPQPLSKEEELRRAVHASWGKGSEQNIALERMQKYRATGAKKFWAWGWLIFCGLAMLSSLAALELSNMLSQAVLATPSLYWIYRNNEDQQTIEDWYNELDTNESLRKVLVGEEQELLSSPANLPLLPQHHWALVIIGTFILAGILGSI